MPFQKKDKMEMHFRECNESDVDLIVKLGKETYFETFSEMNTEENMSIYLAKAFNREKIAAEIRDPNSTFFLLLLRNKPAGYIKVNEKQAQTEIRDDTGIEFERIYNKKEYQGMGLGKVLINKGIEIALKKNKKQIWLGVWEKNTKAILFYEQMGLRKFMTHDFYMGDERQTDHLMKKEICPIQLETS